MESYVKRKLKACKRFFWHKHTKSVRILKRYLSKYTGIKRIEKVQSIIQTVSDINADSSILDLAIQIYDTDENNAKILDMLFKAGTKINYSGTTIMDIAFEQPFNLLTIETILKNGFDFRYIKLSRLLDDTHIHLLDLLIKYGFDINKKNRKGQILLNIACCWKTEFAQELLDKGADPNVIDEKGNSILMNIISRVRIQYSALITLIRLLISYGANAYCINYLNDQTFLMILLTLTSNQVTEFIDEYLDGCNPDYINHKDSRGKTALVYALNNVMTSISIIQKLVERTTIPSDTLLTDIILKQRYTQSLLYQKLEMVTEAGARTNPVTLSKYFVLNARNSTNDKNIDNIHIMLRIGIQKDTLDKSLIDLINKDNNTQTICLLLNYGADYKYMKKEGSKEYCFLSKLNFNKSEDVKFWSIIQKTENFKILFKYSLLPDIQKSFGQLTLHPSSISHRLVSIKWSQDKADTLYQELLAKDSQLVDYFAITRDNVEWKLEAYTRDLYR